MEINITLVPQLVILLLLVGILSQVLFKPMLKVFEERETRIDGAREDARLFASRAEEGAASIDARMMEAQREARSVLTELKAEGQALEAEVIAKARAEAQERIEAARKSLEAQVQTARTALTQDASVIAADVVSKVLNRAA